MSNLWFNIRFKTKHFQMTNDWKFEVTTNTYHEDNPKKFEIYTLFGRQIY